VIDQRIEPQWEAELLDELKKGPLCVGISSMTGPQLRYALAASKLVKAHSSAPVIWGGPHPSLMPEQTLRHELIDVVVEGEGEETLPELLQALEGKRPMGTVRGIWYKDGGRPVKTAPRDFTDLNTQPPLYHGNWLFPVILLLFATLLAALDGEPSTKDTNVPERV